MSTAKTYTIVSDSVATTGRIGEQIGAKLRGGEVIELVSDLGGGKTTFTKGLAVGIGSSDLVSSPSFTINNHYQGQLLHIEHFDFYRLHEAGVVADELREFLDDPKAVVVIEWGDIVHDVLPDHLRLEIKVSGEQQRQLEFTCPTRLQYLLEEK